MAHHVGRSASRQNTAAPDRVSRGSVRTTRTEPARSPRARGSAQGLRVGAANDPLEAEADRIAHQVMRAPAGAADPLDRGGSAPSGGTRNYLGHPSGVLGSGRPLPESERAFFAPRFSWSLANVRIHDEPHASQAAASMSARAFTLGNHVAFAPGEWRPGTPDGRQLLAHELAHIQQSQRGADPGTIRRAMNFEMQLKHNFVWAWDGPGTRPRPLPRKFGPGDALVEDPSGLRLESEAHGQLEFETKWESDWSKIEPQIEAAQSMVTKMNNAPRIDWVEGHIVQEYPFNTDHLRPRGWKVPEGKRAEDFEDNKGGIPDRPLARRRNLIIINDDPSWEAYLQTSESFDLDQFGSFFDSYESNEYDKSRKIGAKEEIVHDRGDFSEYVKGQARSIAADVIKRAQENRNAWDTTEQPRAPQGGAAPVAYVNLENFLTMVISYVYRGLYPAYSPAGKPAKYAFSTMSKTNFGSIFQKLLKPEEQALFASFVRNADTHLSPLGVTKKSPFFSYREGKPKGVLSFNPTIGEWLGSIVAGKDLLSAKDSPRKLPSAMGGRAVENDNKISYEVRVTDKNEVRVDRWLSYTYARFLDAKQRNQSKKAETEPEK